MSCTYLGNIPSLSNERRLPFRALAALSFLTLSGLLLLAACGGDDGDTGTPSGASPAAEESATPEPEGINPCALVTREDAEAAVGAALSDGDRQTTGPFNICIYNSGEAISNYVQVQVSDSVYTQGTFDNAMSSAAAQLQTEAEAVPGIGDKAYWFADVLWVQKGDITLDILVTTRKMTDLRIQEDAEGEKQESLRITTELAGKAVDRLP